ncbi:MAG TPA: hypothetical protein VMW16_03050 [Sedimentisphaerales bacterium]|nr:hypothetical protein [Sedimentisphaerales bacterium]
MKKEAEIQILKVEFSNWVAEEHGRGCDEEDVVRTSDTVQGFINSCREYHAIETDTFSELPVTIIEGSQRFKGEPRRDLYILDVEEHIRLVIAI